MQKAGETVWPNAKKEGNQIKFSGTTPLLRQFNTYLAKDGIMITLFNAKGTIDTYQTDQTKVQEEDNTLEEAWYRGIAKINPKDTMTQRLKRFFDTIPVYTAGTANDRANAQIVTNYFGAAQTESGSKIFSYLIERISGSRNVDEMMKKLEDLQRAKPFIRQIVNELKNNESLKSDLFIHIGSKSYMTYLISIYDKFTGNFIITPSNRKNLNEIINQDLVSNFENQGNLLFNKHKGGQKRGRDFENINAQAVHTFEADLKEAQNVLKKNPGSVLQGKDLKDLSESLNKYGFFLSEVELGQLQASENLKEARTSMENFLASMLSLTNMLKNNKNPFLYDKAPSTIKTKGIQGDKGIVGKIAASISKIYDTQVQSSFRNVNDETIYNLQPSSFLTEKIS